MGSIRCRGFETSGCPFRSICLDVFYHQPPSIRLLLPHLCKDSRTLIDFAPVMKDRSAPSTHDNWVSKRNHANMIMRVRVHFEVRVSSVGHNLVFGEAFSNSKPLADPNDLVG